MLYLKKEVCIQSVYINRSHFYKIPCMAIDQQLAYRHFVCSHTWSIHMDGYTITVRVKKCVTQMTGRLLLKQEYVTISEYKTRLFDRLKVIQEASYWLYVVVVDSLAREWEGILIVCFSAFCTSTKSTIQVYETSLRKCSKICTKMLVFFF